MVLLVIIGGVLTLWGTLGFLARTIGDLVAAALMVGAGLLMLYIALRISRSA